MGERPYRIGVVAPGGRIGLEIQEKLAGFVNSTYVDFAPEIVFHPQCFEVCGHFAGNDEQRQNAFVETANDPDFDAVWFARGGYGACRIAEPALAQLSDQARRKAYLGYSDGGYLLAGLYKAGIGRVAHGPMPCDVARPGGEAAVRRALDWLISNDSKALEPSLRPGQKAAAFNLTVLSQLLGTPLQPDLADHVLMLEEVWEYMYRIDRSLFHVTSNPAIRQVAGLRLGRCSEVPENDPDFVQTEEEVVQYWCARSGIPFLGRADIGHDVDNKVVPFGRFA